MPAALGDVAHILGRMSCVEYTCATYHGHSAYHVAIKNIAARSARDHVPEAGSPVPDRWDPAHEDAHRSQG